MASNQSKLRYLNLIVTILMEVWLVFTPLSTYADSNPYILLDTDKGVSSVITDVNSYTKPEYGIDFMRTARGNSKKVFINKTGYLQLKTIDKQDIMKHALDAIQNSSMGGRDQSRLYNFVEDQDQGTASAVRQLSTDVSPDVATASSIVKPFTGPLSTFLGLACIVIFFMLSLAITVDIMFLTIPAFQAFCTRNDGLRPSYISQEAWDALLVAESNLGTGGNPSVWGVYFRSRTKTLIIVGLTLGYLIGGEVFDLATFIVDFFLSIFK